jgi:hypothetical protein
MSDVPAPAAPEPKWSGTPPLAGWAILVSATLWPWLQATVLPPRGLRFLGTFFYFDDYYNYLSFVQQAADGAFAFRSKLIPGSPATLVNLEWWLVGRLSTVLGDAPHVAYRIFGIVSAFALVMVADRWLKRGGLPQPHRLAALTLIGFGAGFGGFRALAGARVHECPDVIFGMFPFVEVLTSPHFVAATALLAWSLLLLVLPRRPQHTVVGVLLGTVLGLVRAYDLVLLLAIFVATVLATERAASWPRRLLWPVLGLMPVLLYDVHVYFIQPYFRTYGHEYFIPLAQNFASPVLALLTGLGPATAMAALAWRSPGVQGSDGRRARAALTCWAGAALAALLASFVPHSPAFLQQCVVGMGLPLLVLAALGLAPYPRGWTLAATALLGSTAFFTLRAASSPSPEWYEPQEVLEPAHAFRHLCRPGDIVVAPEPMGLYAAGLSACDSYVGHDMEPHHISRRQRLNGIYTAAAAADRARLLDETCASFIVFPGSVATIPVAWLGPATPFRLVGTVEIGENRVGLYGRPRPARCVPADTVP